MRTVDLVVENAEWIRLKARMYYHNKAEADDLASETIYKCLKNVARFKAGMSFKPWATAIMQNTYITQYNRRCCVLFCPLDGSAPRGAIAETDQRASVQRILSIVGKCSTRSINIECVMLYARGYKQSEIAEMLGIPQGTVKSRVSIGRKMLRQALGE